MAGGLNEIRKYKARIADEILEKRIETENSEQT